MKIEDGEIYFKPSGVDILFFMFVIVGSIANIWYAIKYLSDMCDDPSHVPTIGIITIASTFVPAANVLVGWYHILLSEIPLLKQCSFCIQ